MLSAYKNSIQIKFTFPVQVLVYVSGTCAPMEHSFGQRIHLRRFMNLEKYYFSEISYSLEL